MTNAATIDDKSKVPLLASESGVVVESARIDEHAEGQEETAKTFQAEDGERRVDRRKSVRSGRHSHFARAFGIFVVLNLVLTFSSPFDLDKFQFPYKGWAWWTFNELRDSSRNDNVALMGSSLMVSATNGCDANALNKPLNLVYYHGAQYFDMLLTQKVGGTFKTFNLSAPGQMPSDAYMTLLAMLKTSHRPDFLIYGVAPRDFYDSSLSSPIDTEPFRFLRRLVDLDGTVHKMFRSPFSKLNWLLEENVYLYGNSLDFQLMCTKQAETVVDQILPTPRGKKPYTYWDRIALIPEYKPGEIHNAAIVIQPEDPAHPLPWKDNTKEYIDRYKNPDAGTYSTQFYFLNKIAEVCEREKIELVIVNMPITMDNIKLLGTYRYMGFIHALYRFSQEHNVPTFDLNDFKNFKMADYQDGVHLNGQGGRKVFDELVHILANTSRTRVALELAGQKLHKQRALVADPTPTQLNMDIQL